MRKKTQIAREKDLEVFFADQTLLASIGFAESSEAFRRMIGVSPQTIISVARSADPQHRAFAEEAGPGFFMNVARASVREAFQKREIREGRDAIRRRTLEKVREMVSGKGNSPAISLVEARAPVEEWRGAGASESAQPIVITINEHLTATVPEGYRAEQATKRKKRFLVCVDGETRGYWERTGAEWRLHDATGHAILLRRSFALNLDADGFHDRTGSASHAGFRAAISPWDEALALRLALQAWEEGAFPPLPAQQERSVLRAARQQEKQRQERGLRNLALRLEKLERVLLQAHHLGIPEAEELLAALGTPRVAPGAESADETVNSWSEPGSAPSVTRR